MMSYTAADFTNAKFQGLVIDLPGLGKVELETPFKETSETAIYQVTHPGVVVKTFDLSCGKPGEISYGPYLRFSLELANFEELLNIDSVRRYLPAYYGANVLYDKEVAYIAMEFFAGQDLLTWFHETISAQPDGGWEEIFKEAIYEALSVVSLFHRHGVMVVDFKPDNIIRMPGRGIKFVDLGAFFTPQHAQETEKYLYSATPDYAELLIDASNMQTGIPLNQSSDIFSIGVALFELATGSSRLEIQGDTADEILAKPEIYKFRDSQIRDLWGQFPHLKDLLPLVESQLKERQLLFAEIWHILKGYLAAKLPEWENLEPAERDQTLLATGTTFIQEQLPANLQWLSGPIAQATVLRSLRLKRVLDLQMLIQNPLPEPVQEDLKVFNTLITYMRDLEGSVDFLHHLNTWEARPNPLTGHWSVAAPVAFARFYDNAQFTFLKQSHRDNWGNRYFQVVSDLEADDYRGSKLTLWDIQDDHMAWV